MFGIFVVTTVVFSVSPVKRDIAIFYFSSQELDGTRIAGQIVTCCHRVYGQVLDYDISISQVYLT
jgi:hypothetical protein